MKLRISVVDKEHQAFRKRQTRDQNANNILL